MDKLKKHILSLLPYSSKTKFIYSRKQGFSSSDYWEKRYEEGGDSGFGSYGEYANLKARVINTIIKEHNIHSVLELGCGDGNQASLFKIPLYTGLDISQKSVEQCQSRFKDDKTKNFGIYTPEKFPEQTEYHNQDLSMSLDVIYHLVEDEVFEDHMRDLFLASDKYVLIYSSDTSENDNLQSIHVRHRKFSDWIDRNLSDWELIEEHENSVDLSTPNVNYLHSAKFFLYARKNNK